ncbi:MAG: HNH endonuclease domain-containing protein [Vicingaceae bacterium]|nr:HNH endonuclease domain-containing protein [Vicingaceae bacterium]
MKKIKLGLDLGTNSIGWAVLEKKDGKYDFLEKFDEKGNLIPTKGSYIFPKGVNADENSKAAERRGFRGARRRLERIILRKINTLKVLNEFGLCPPFEEGELSDWKNKKIYPCKNEKFIEWQRTGRKNGNAEGERLKQPYYLRHLAATKEGLMGFEQGRLQLGRAFYHLSQRRGYLSNGDEEQSEDKLELFKNELTKLLEEVNTINEFREPYKVIFENRNTDKKVKTIDKKINTWLKKEKEYNNLKDSIIEEINKPDNEGKVMSSINELSGKINEAFEKGECAPTMGSYFYSIYAKADKKTGLISKIRGRYTHREEHYLKEFNYICDKQNIKKDLREKLHHAIFYQRPLKSQKGLVAMCPLEDKRKRIAVSHPLFEEFRMWESINRIKIGRGEKTRLDFLTKEEKELIKPLFLQKTDFEFSKIANKLSGETMYCYSKKSKEVFHKGTLIEGGVAEIVFNFPLDKKFSACPTISALTKLLGKDTYNEMLLLNTGYKEEKNKQQISVEDIWHCLFLDDFGKKDRSTIRREFAERYLGLDKKGIEDFQKIKLAKGYGNLSKSALKKIVPHLEKGLGYSDAVFLANIDKVLGRKLSEQETKVVSEQIQESLKEHKYELKINGIVNNYISKLKTPDENNQYEQIGNNSHSIEAHKKSLFDEIIQWEGAEKFNSLSEKKQDEIKVVCWDRLSNVALDKSPKEFSYLKTTPIPEIIGKKLLEKFPNDKIDVLKLYHPSAMDKYKTADKKLGNPEISSIKNPVFNRSMHQIKRLCNELIRKGIVDKDTEVNVEVAGEINSASYRKAIAQWQKEQEIIRDWAKNEIINTYPKECHHEIHPSDADIIKYILWKEQNHQCIYTGSQISVCDFLGGKTSFDVEHTIPRSKFHDNSLANKTLADAEFNRDYKIDTLPGLLNEKFKGKTINKESVLLNRNANLRSYSFSGKQPNISIQWNITLKSLKDDLKKFKNAAKAISDPISHDEVMTKAHYTKIKLDYLSKKYRNFECEEITSQFTNANLVDTRIIAKYARAYLNSYFNKVNVVNGKITDTLRKMWGLEGEYAKKDRSNHIHHCIDAVTVACVERGTANWIAEAFHKYESDYFNGNDNPKYRIKAPMDNFAERMHNLHKEVFIYHRQIDRIKPLLEAIEKGNKTKQNLRGKLNSQNPYAHIKKNGKLIFAKREPITKISGGDIENIIDEGIKDRLLKLADEKGWKKLMEFPVKEGEDKDEKEIEHKKSVAFRVYEKIKKADKKKEIIHQGITKETIISDFSSIDEFINSLINTIVRVDIDEKKRENYKKKIIKEAKNLTRSKGLEILLNENKESENPAIILPEYYDEKKKKQIGRMVIKNIRLKSSKSNLKDYKEIRAIDKSKLEHKRDYYFDKDSYTNYEARIFGDLIPDENGKLKNRKYKLINHYNIVKNIFDEETEKPILRLHQDDTFLVFDKIPSDEINWKSNEDLQSRLFKIVKFDENGIIVLVRHNYAKGNVDNSKAIKSEINLSDLSEVVLRRSPSTLRIIPTKVDALGSLDVEYSKSYL